MAGNVGVVVLLSALWILVSAVFVWGGSGPYATFPEDFQITWSDGSHVKQIDGGNTIQLMLDQNSGSGIGSKSKYMFGRVSAYLKLHAGDSAGTVTAFYLNSDTDTKRDELDFEFLGNRSGQPYTLQTNIYINGKGDREERFYLWFDPAADFHFYTITWNQNRITFSVDGLPIRVYENNEENGIPYPSKQAMGVYCTVWAADWATRGGLEKIDWSKAPFNAYYNEFYILGCKVSGPENCTSMNPPWDEIGPEFSYRWYKWVRQHYMIYDYCQDKARNPVTPPECVDNNHGL